MKIVIMLSMFVAAAHGFMPPLGRYRSPFTPPAAAVPQLPPQQLLSSQTALRSTTAPVMGLFGLGTPEIAIICGVAMLVLGPEQLKKMAKDVGKVSAELKQVPEEFNKGMEAGAAELEAKKSSITAEAPKPAAKEEGKEA
mmetsp:Transcript_20252/g.41387  ORF Transcript_20252/g.41387 Transcript_20252/m.41387 type:complete len:140 (-) Transcript_20252:288-707(-)